MWSALQYPWSARNYSNNGAVMKELYSIPASSLERAMLCAGSPRFENIIKFAQTDDAAEGDTFEELLARMVLGQPIGDRASNGNIFTKEMFFFANQMLPYIPKGSQYQTDCSWITEHTQRKMSNRLDFYHAGETELEILDVKYGWGIVEVKYQDGIFRGQPNWQLVDYAIGMVLKLGRAFKTIKFTIVQPRPHHEDGSVRSVTISYAELKEYKDQIEKRVASMHNNNNTELVTGDHCRYCKAGDSYVCPAKNKAFFNTIAVVMSELRQDHLDEESISQMLDLLDEAKSQLKIHEKSLEQLAIHRMKNNKIIPNYALTDSYGHREWLPETNPESIKFLTGLEATKVEMMSPSEFEKTHSVPEMLLKALTKRPFKGTKLKRTDAGKLADEVFKTKEGK